MRIVKSPNSSYRIGGYEFVVLMPGSTGGPELVAHIAGALCEPYSAEALPVTLAASVGYADAVTDDVEVLPRAADAAMYRNKARPR